MEIVREASSYVEGFPITNTSTMTSFLLPPRLSAGGLDFLGQRFMPQVDLGHIRSGSALSSWYGNVIRVVVRPRRVVGQIS